MRPTAPASSLISSFENVQHGHALCYDLERGDYPDTGLGDCAFVDHEGNELRTFAAAVEHWEESHQDVFVWWQTLASDEVRQREAEVPGEMVAGLEEKGEEEELEGKEEDEMEEVEREEEGEPELEGEPEFEQPTPPSKRQKRKQVINLFTD